MSKARTANKARLNVHGCRGTEAVMLAGASAGDASARDGGVRMKDNVAGQQPVEVGAVDVEAFANNLARMVEEGGKALAAYMKPREEGAVAAGLSDEITDVVKTLGQVAEYWLSDPQRAVELQSRLGKAYLDLWGARGQAHGRRERRARWSRPTRRTSASPIRNGRRTSSSISSSRPICSRTQLGRPPGRRTPRASTRTRARRPSSTCGRSPTRSRRRISC